MQKSTQVIPTADDNGQVLVIRKQDKTIHIVPTSMEAFHKSMLRKLPSTLQYVIEKMNVEDAKKLPFIDMAFVTATDALNQNKKLQASLSAKDDEIEQLKKLLAEKTASAGTDNGEQSKSAPAAAPVVDMDAKKSTPAATTTEDDFTGSNAPAQPINTDASAPVAKPLEKMNKGELRAEADRLQIKWADEDTNATLIKKIKGIA